MRRIESIGSYWEIDEDLKRYRRWPKEETPRPNEWGGPEAGALQDLVWHEYHEVTFTPMTSMGLARLVIILDEKGHTT